MLKSEQKRWWLALPQARCWQRVYSAQAVLDRLQGWTATDSDRQYAAAVTRRLIRDFYHDGYACPSCGKVVRSAVQLVAAYEDCELADLGFDPFFELLCRSCAWIRPQIRRRNNALQGGGV